MSIGCGVTDQGEIYAQFVAGELEHERKRREQLDARANGTIVTSAGLLGLAVAVGIFDPGSLSEQTIALRRLFLVGAALTVISALFAMWAGWRHGYKVADSEDVSKLLTDCWGESQATARGRVAWFNSQTLETLRSANKSKSIKLVSSHVLQLMGLLLFLTAALAATLRSVV